HSRISNTAMSKDKESGVNITAFAGG
ncbi:MAG: hypothetical protein PWP64_1045, partial [Candidatus Cloacimonadota bacterium]|nr:hypothetical protein [Candidatus Cloacimonadota bacterium]